MFAVIVYTGRSTKLIKNAYADKKKTKFSSYTYKEIQMGSGAKSYMRKGVLICEEMRNYLR